MRNIRSIIKEKLFLHPKAGKLMVLVSTNNPSMKRMEGHEFIFPGFARKGDPVMIRAYKSDELIRTSRLQETEWRENTVIFHTKNSIYHFVFEI